MPQDNIAYRTDSVAGAAVAISAGLGVGYLPCMIGDLSPHLLRVGPVEPALNDELWLLTHPDIRKSGRIYAFMTHCAECMGKNRELIEGLHGTILGPAGLGQIDPRTPIFRLRCTGREHRYDFRAFRFCAGIRF